MINNTNTRKKTKVNRALNYFFEKIANGLRNKFLNEIEVRIPEEALNKYAINQFKDKTQSLIIIGKLSDLNDKAIVGLIAHLYGLIYMGYGRSPVPKEKEWLRVDLHSDEVAKSWGFKTEVEELRKTRPQKIPIQFDYEIPILEYSVPDFEFKKDLSNILNNISSENFVAGNRILYIGKFSSVCNIESLREYLIKYLYIITNSYANDKKVLNFLLMR